LLLEGGSALAGPQLAGKRYMNQRLILSRENQALAHRAAAGESEQERKTMRIGIAPDHGGFELKQGLATRLRDTGHEVMDFGAHRFVLRHGETIKAGGEIRRP
jgi:hypothetical protein